MHTRHGMPPPPHPTPCPSQTTQNRLSSCIFPWMASYQMEELPDWPAIQQVRQRDCV
jgi:hypothetical protein